MPYLRTALLQPTRALPAGRRRTGKPAITLLDFAPDVVCRPAALPLPWRALTPPFHLFRIWKTKAGSLLSVALSVLTVKLPVPGVTRHHALRSPDFPPRVNRNVYIPVNTKRQYGSL